MASFSEKSFGARFQNAQTIVTYLENLPDYNPPQATESVAVFKVFLETIKISNTSGSEYLQLYKAAVKARENAFKANSISLRKLLAPIRGAVEAAYGKYSQQTQAVGALIKKMRTKKYTVKSPIVQLPPPGGDQVENQTQNAANSISTSQQSYGSLMNFFNDLITTLTQFNNYNPSNPDIQIQALQAFAASLKSMSQTLDQEYQKLFTERKKRLALYEELHQRVLRIKSYLRSQYGLTSEIYGLVKGLLV